MANVRPAMVSCFGGGGAFGIGFNMGVAAGLLDESIDIRQGPMIGTSSGGYTVAALAGGIAFEHLADLWTKYTETHGSIWVRTADLTEEIYRDVTAAGIATVALTLWRFRRRLLRAEDHPVSDIVAASASPFPFARPHKIGRRRYLDGGMRRLASADLAPNADLLLLVTPFCSKQQGFTGRAGLKQSRKEIPRWKESTGGEVLHIRPPEEILAMKVGGLKGLSDMRLAAEVFKLARDSGRKSATTLRQDAPGVVERLENPGAPE
jgi:predicted acylesterase/phospholipase RssA